MTKTTKEAVAPQVEEAVPTVSDEERSERWLRDSALAFAINHHKNNGGITTATQVVVNANVFLNFLRGEAQ